MATANVIQNPSLSQELRLAVATASIGDTGKTRKVHLLESDLPSLVPSQSLLKVRSVKFNDLKMGDIVCVRVGNKITVRRFVKTKITRSHTLLLTAEEGADKKEALPQNCLLGKVDKVSFGGQTFDPASKENFLQKFWGKLSEYGTHKPFGIFSAR